MNDDYVYIQIDPGDINYVTRILEGYEYLGVLTTVDPIRGIAEVRSVRDTKEEAKAVLKSLPVAVRFLSSEEAAACKNIKKRSD